MGVQIRRRGRSPNGRCVQRAAVALDAAKLYRGFETETADSVPRVGGEGGVPLTGVTLSRGWMLQESMRAGPFSGNDSGEKGDDFGRNFDARYDMVRLPSATLAPGLLVQEERKGQR
eukprot:GHVU01136769.1.p1 GENE.GHVU01136769.1~~GHVU01136769.1.p1  ORF type:complete len:117 (+),score=12.58 GHVU01136769.1:458-808(+)